MRASSATQLFPPSRETPEHDAASTETLPTSEDRLLTVLDRTIEALHGAGLPFLVIGGIASAAWGRDRETTDVDLLVRPELAHTVLRCLAAQGFDTSTRSEHWLHKAKQDGVTVDVITRASRDILLDEEMVARGRIGTFRGRQLPVAAPEDVLLMKLGAAAEDTSRYWYDALGILARAELDWDYLVMRARQHGARRVLSLLLFAMSIDLVVPKATLAQLWTMIQEPEADHA